MGSLEAFQAQRPRLLAIGYRMLGSASEAEDVVQEAWLRWQAAPGEVASERAWLSTAVTRLCLDRIRRVRARREAYVGPWLPEPTGVEEPGELDPESLSLAFLVLLERLGPVERAVYVLREVFDHGFAEIADAVGRSEAACRQIHHRARARILEGRPRFSPSPEAHERLLSSFAQAVTTGDLEPLKRMLATDVVVYGDGGGKVRAALRPIRGADAVARFLLGVYRKAPAGQSYERRRVNGRPAIVGVVAGRVSLVLDLVEDGEQRIEALYAVLNPEKLGHV